MKPTAPTAVKAAAAKATGIGVRRRQATYGGDGKNDRVSVLHFSYSQFVKFK
jgi:hypothetical protein